MTENDSFKKELAKEVAKQLPVKEIYNDLLHPTLGEVGKALQGATRIALAPISAMVWGYDRISHYLDYALPQYFEKRRISKENICVPDVSIAVPTIEAMRYTSEKDEIRQMFTNLLGASMNKDTCDKVHPAYVEIIKQLSQKEAVFLNYLKEYRKALVDYDCPLGFFNKNIIDVENAFEDETIESYIDSLIRLGIFEKTLTNRYSCESEFSVVEKMAMQEIKYMASEEEMEVDWDSIRINFYYYWLELTSFGDEFVSIVLN